MAKSNGFVISRQQAHEFAKAIYSDIEDYVRSHQQEFEEFLEEQRKEAVTLCSGKEQSEHSPI